MSTRERWIVYPLLFLALGIAMRNHFLPTEKLTVEELSAQETFSAKDIRARRILCDELMILGQNGAPTVVLSSDRNSTAGGVVITIDRFGRITDVLGKARVSVHRNQQPEKSPEQQPTESEPARSPEDAGE